MKTLHANQWTRREFTVQSALAMLSGVTITLSSCGDSNSSTAPSTTSTSTPASAPASAGDIVGAIGANHGHTAVITAAQLTTANAVDLDISGSANHPHTVNLTATEVGQIAGGTRVTKLSSNNDGSGFGSHTHTVTFN